jgi:hypothetical protein
MKLLMMGMLCLCLFISCGDTNTTSTEVESEFTVAGTVLPHTLNKKMIQYSPDGLALDTVHVQSNGEFSFKTNQKEFLLSSSDSVLQFKYDSTYIDKHIVMSYFSKLFINGESTIFGKQVNPNQLLTLAEGGSLVSLNALDYAYFETVISGVININESTDTSKTIFGNFQFNQAFVQYYKDNELSIIAEDIEVWQQDSLWIKERESDLNRLNNPNTECNEIYEPVCYEGKTYDNACFARQDGGEIFVKGVCENDQVICTTVQIQRPLCLIGDAQPVNENGCLKEYQCEGGNPS